MTPESIAGLTIPEEQLEDLFEALASLKGADVIQLPANLPQAA